jgi:hypothetical protein
MNACRVPTAGDLLLSQLPSTVSSTTTPSFLKTGHLPTVSTAQDDYHDKGGLQNALTYETSTVLELLLDAVCSCAEIPEVGRRLCNRQLLKCLEPLCTYYGSPGIIKRFRNHSRCLLLRYTLWQADYSPGQLTSPQMADLQADAFVWRHRNSQQDGFTGHARFEGCSRLGGPFHTA